MELSENLDSLSRPLFRMVGEMGPLFAAKAKARLGFRPIERNRTVRVQSDRGAYTFDYATLDSVRGSCDQALAENGLDIWSAWVDLPDGGKELITVLSHASGAFIECHARLPRTKQTRDGEKELTIQEQGSAKTYYERYSYVALAGVASEHDDDGNEAEGNKVQEMAQRGPRRTPPAPQESRIAPQASPAQKRQSEPPAAPTVVQMGEPQNDASQQNLQNGAALTEETKEAIRGAFRKAKTGDGKEYTRIAVLQTIRALTGKSIDGANGVFTESDGQKVLDYLRDGVIPEEASP